MKPIFLALIFGVSLLAWSCSSDDEPNVSCIDESKKCIDCRCTYHYMPVCGCDGQTYGNECMATYAGVRSFSEGKCP